jgi:predicted O-methyltransferase YrrM
MRYNLLIPGWMSVVDLEILNRLASYVPENGSILEVGCFVGRSTSALFSGKPASATLEVVDTFDVSNPYGLHISDNNIKGSQYYKNKIKEIAKNTGSWEESFRFCLTPEVADHIQISVASSLEYNLTKQFDMVFIDANHAVNHVLHDIKKFASKNTLLVGDDFSKTYLGVAEALALVHFEIPSTLIAPSNSKIWIMVPEAGYWNNLFLTVPGLLVIQVTV